MIKRISGMVLKGMVKLVLANFVNINSEILVISANPSLLAGSGISNGTMNALLKREGYKPYTVHGFRSTFRDYVQEETNTAWRTAEEALAHKLSDKAEAAYQRTDLLEKRKVLMEIWANYCYQPTGKIIKMPRAN